MNFWMPQQLIALLVKSCLDNTCSIIITLLRYFLFVVTPANTSKTKQPLFS